MKPESSFTKSSSTWCRHPEWWSAPDSEATEDEVSELVAALVRAIKPSYAIETGSYHGHTSKAIGLALKRNGFGHLHTFEVDRQRHEVTRKAVDGLPVTAHLKSSLRFVPQEKVDFAWFDSLLHLRKQEFLRFRPYMEPGTLVAFHDASPQHQIIIDDVNDLVTRNLIRVVHLRTPRGVILAEVLARSAMFI